MTDFYYLRDASISLVMYFTDQRYQLFVPSLTLAFQIFFVIHVVYLKPIEGATILRNVGFISLYFFSSTIGGILVTYIQQLHTILKFTNDEHVKLLNGMHEGLLIVKKIQKDENATS